MISKHEVEHITRLAKIELTSEEIERFQRELSRVLEYFAILENADMADITLKPCHVLSRNVAREDTDTPVSPTQRGNLTGTFPESENGYCKVKAVFSERDDNA